jgi:hypothetical protein
VSADTLSAKYYIYLFDFIDKYFWFDFSVPHSVPHLSGDIKMRNSDPIGPYVNLHSCTSKARPKAILKLFVEGMSAEESQRFGSPFLECHRLSGRKRGVDPREVVAKERSG